MGGLIITIFLILRVYGVFPSAFSNRTLETVEADDRGPRGASSTVSD